MTKITFKQINDTLKERVVANKKYNIRVMVCSNLPTGMLSNLSTNKKDIKNEIKKNYSNLIRKRDIYADSHRNYIDAINDIGKSLAEKFGEKYIPFDKYKECKVFYQKTLPIIFKFR